MLNNYSSNKIEPVFLANLSTTHFKSQEFYYNNTMFQVCGIPDPDDRGYLLPQKQTLDRAV